MHVQSMRGCEPRERFCVHARVRIPRSNACVYRSMQRAFSLTRKTFSRTKIEESAQTSQ